MEANETRRTHRLLSRHEDTGPQPCWPAAGTC